MDLRIRLQAPDREMSDEGLQQYPRTNTRALMEVSRRTEKKGKELIYVAGKRHFPPGVGENSPSSHPCTTNLCHSRFPTLVLLQTNYKTYQFSNQLDPHVSHAVPRTLDCQHCYILGHALPGILTGFSSIADESSLSSGNHGTGGCFVLLQQRGFPLGSGFTLGCHSQQLLS